MCNFLNVLTLVNMKNQKTFVARSKLWYACDVIAMEHVYPCFLCAHFLSLSVSIRLHPIRLWKWYEDKQRRRRQMQSFNCNCAHLASQQQRVATGDVRVRGK
jgi:hypothetical protein